MANNAIESTGVVLEYDDTGWTAISEVTDFRFGGSAAAIDVTHLGSTFKEKLMGVPDEGQAVFELNLVPAGAGQVQARADRAARTRRQFRVTLTDTGATVVSFWGFVLGFEVSGGNDAKVAATLTVEVDGEATWT